MAQDPEDRKLWVVKQLGQEGNAAFADQVETLWDLNEDRPGITLRTLYTLLDGIDALAGGTYLKFHDYTAGGVSESKGQVPRNLDLLRQSAWKKIERLEKRISAARPAVVGQLTTAAVLTNPAGFPDPNDRALRGDALKRRPVDPLLDLVIPQ